MMNKQFPSLVFEHVCKDDSDEVVLQKIKSLVGGRELLIRTDAETGATSVLNAARQRVYSLLQVATSKLDEESRVMGPSELLVTTLGLFGGEEDLDFLERLVTDDALPHEIRYLGIKAILSIGGPKALKFLDEFGDSSKNEELADAADVAYDELLVGGKYDLSIGPSLQGRKKFNEYHPVNTSIAANYNTADFDDAIYEYKQTSKECDYHQISSILEKYN